MADFRNTGSPITEKSNLEFLGASLKSGASIFFNDAFLLILFESTLGGDANARATRSTLFCVRAACKQRRG